MTGPSEGWPQLRAAAVDDNGCVDGSEAWRVEGGGRRLIDVLATAFAEDPWLRWTLPDPGAVRALMSLFLRTVAFPHGEVWVAGAPAPDGATIDGVAVILPPTGVPTESPEVGAMVIATHGSRAGTALDADAVIGRHRPADPTWVLHTIGVVPEAQGHGVGRALLSAVLRRAGDTPLTLETTNPLARDWYVRNGFTIDHTVVLADGFGLPADAPTVWLLSHRP